MPKIKVLKDKIAFEGNFLRIIRRHFIGIHGKRGVWEVVERKTFGPVVAVIAVTSRQELVITRAYRQPLKKYVLELPIGLMDRRKEKPQAAARRELLEETGYIASTFKKIVIGPANTGLTKEMIIFYLAESARIKSKPQHENGEEIKVIKIPLAKAFRYLTSSHDKVDLKLFAALYLLQKKGYNC